MVARASEGVRGARLRAGHIKNLRLRKTPRTSDH